MTRCAALENGLRRRGADEEAGGDDREREQGGDEPAGRAEPEHATHAPRPQLREQERDQGDDGEEADDRPQRADEGQLHQ